MSILKKLQSELKNAGTAARGALDEGKVRIEIFRVRQSADAAAQALGYAVHRARRDGRELDADTLDRLDGTLTTHETAATRLEGELIRHRTGTPPGPPEAGDAGPRASSESTPAAGSDPAADPS